MMSPWLAKKIKRLLILWLAFAGSSAMAGKAEQLYRQAERAEQKLKATDHFEKERFHQALAKYYQVFQVGDPVWTHRAAYRIGRLTEDFFGKHRSIRHEVSLLYKRLLERSKKMNLDKELVAELVKTQLRKPLR